MSIRLLTFIALLFGILTNANGQSDVYKFENPFYEDCVVLDATTHKYIKKNGIAYVKKSITRKDKIYSTIIYYYNKRSLLDSTVLRYGLNLQHSSHYGYDSLFRLVTKIDSFFSQSVLDSIHHRSWDYYEDGMVKWLNKSKAYYRKTGYPTFRIYPTIEFDTLIGDMYRYRYSQILWNNNKEEPEQSPKETVGGLEWQSSFADNPNFYFWIQDGRLVLKGTDNLFESVKVKEHGEGYDLSYYVFRNDTNTCLGVQTFGTDWQPSSSSVFYNGEWVVIDDNKYMRDVSLVLSSHYEVESNILTTITYIRDKGSQQLTKGIIRELYPYYLDPTNKESKQIERVTNVSYEYSKVIPD